MLWRHAGREPHPSPLQPQRGNLDADQAVRVKPEVTVGLRLPQRPQPGWPGPGFMTILKQHEVCTYNTLVYTPKPN